MVVFGWVLGCGGPPAGDVGEAGDRDEDHTGTVTGPETGDHTGSATGDSAGIVVDTGPGAALTARCDLQSQNALRFDCDVRVDPPQPIEFRWQKSDGTGPERVHRDEAAAAVRSVVLWNFAPATDYDLRVIAGGAEVDLPLRTGVLPPSVDVDVASSGTSTAGRFLSTSPCVGGSALVFDPAGGDVLWYEPLGPGGGAFLEGVSWTDDDTVIGLVGGNVEEVAWDGSVVRQLFAGVDLPNRVHHDVFKRAGLIYVIFQETVQVPTDVWVDGFYVFDAVGLSWEWHLADFRTPDPANLGRNGADWSHGNAIWADATGDVYASYRHLSAIFKIEGDPLDPAFGQPQWSLVGDVESVITGDLTLRSIGLAGFEQQHNVHVLPSGELTMFDNRVGLERSRIVDLAVDPIAHTATMTREWPMPGNVSADGHCDFQGGAWRTDAGNPVGTCAPFREGKEFDAVSGDVVWSGQIQCRNGSSSYVPRFVPLPP